MERRSNWNSSQLLPGHLSKVRQVSCIFYSSPVQDAAAAPLVFIGLLKSRKLGHYFDGKLQSGKLANEEVGLWHAAHKPTFSLANLPGWETPVW